jgi:hypothetical protein
VIPALTCVPWEAREEEAPLEHDNGRPSPGMRQMMQGLVLFRRLNGRFGLGARLDSFSERSLYRRLVRPGPVQ